MEKNENIVTDIVQAGLEAMAKRLKISVEEATKIARADAKKLRDENIPGGSDSASDIEFHIREAQKKIKKGK